MKDLFRIRTITGFVTLNSDDFPANNVDDKSNEESTIGRKISALASTLRDIEKELIKEGYTVQSIRMATNPFSEWLVDDNSTTGGRVEQIAESRLEILDHVLSVNKIESVSLGPAEFEHNNGDIIKALCCKIIEISPRFFCSVNIPSCDTQSARIAAQCMLDISRLGSSADDDDKEKTNGNDEDKTTNERKRKRSDANKDHVIGGLGNFRFCAAASCKPFIPFFPAAKSSSKNVGDSSDSSNTFKFALGLENGALACKLLEDCKSIGKIKTDFLNGITSALAPVQSICEEIVRTRAKKREEEYMLEYLGIDSSLNPSLDKGGSVAEAIENLDEMNGRAFGAPGTLAAAAALTEAIQSLPNIRLTGYCGLMLPLCEDRRLAELVNDNDVPLFGVSDLLNISNVCGVGVDTVPIPGDCSEDDLTSFLLDVAGIAGRWNKSLSCRLFPIPGKSLSELTTFDFQHLVNVKVLGL